MSHKSFAAALADAKQEPITFDLGDDAEFSIQRPLPGLPVAQLAALADEGGTKAIAAFLEFFEAAMEPDEFQRFKKEANDRRIDLSTLIDIAGFVIAEGSGRPTPRRSDSSES